MTVIDVWPWVQLVTAAPVQLNVRLYVPATFPGLLMKNVASWFGRLGVSGPAEPGFGVTATRGVGGCGDTVIVTLSRIVVLVCNTARSLMEPVVPAAPEVYVTTGYA